jgi:hypothetical protein
LSLIPVDWYYPLCALLFWILALALIPKEKMKPLFWYGLIWGFLAGCMFAWIFGIWLKLLDYNVAEPFKPFGVCIWLAFGWVPAIMIFLNHLPPKKLWYALPLYILIFALASASLEDVFHLAGLLKYRFWNPFFRFIVALIWFWGAQAHYNMTKEVFRGDGITRES